MSKNILFYINFELTQFSQEKSLEGLFQIDKFKLSRKKKVGTPINKAVVESFSVFLRASVSFLICN